MHHSNLSDQCLELLRMTFHEMRGPFEASTTAKELKVVPLREQADN